MMGSMIYEYADLGMENPFVLLMKAVVEANGLNFLISGSEGKNES